MDPQSEKQLLIDQYQSYAQILSEKGVTYHDFSTEELETMSVRDLTRVVRQAKELARTPLN